MDKLMRQTKGAISIFLVIVLLPMLTVASVFVDTARIELANSMAESAGDLTLNTALTNYDSELKNLYGLFAASQDMDELMEDLEDYYRDSIIAAGVDSAAADDYVGQIMDYLKTQTGTDDLMNIELTGMEVSVPAGGNLGNPAILKSQIVEFMKYRAPLSLGTGFLDALSTLKDLSKQTELVEDKNAFYEEYQSLLETLEKAWREIQAYQYASKDVNFPTGRYILDRGEDLQYAVDPLKTAVELSVKYLQDLSYFKKLQFQINLNPGDDADSEDDDYWELAFNSPDLSPVAINYTEDDPATADNIVEYAKDTMQAIKTMESCMNTNPYRYVFELANTADPVPEIYAVKLLNKDGSSYFNAVKNLLSCLVNLKAAMETCSEDTMVIYNWDQNTMDYASQGGQSVRKIAQGYLDDHLNLDQGGYFYYFQSVVNKANGYYSEHYASIYGDSGYVKRANANIDLARDTAYTFYMTLQARANNLSNAIAKLKTVQYSLENGDSAYQTTLKEWEKSADNLSDNTMGKNDAAEIEEIKSIITVDRVTDLITRLEGAETTVRGYMSQIEQYTIEGTKWKDISDNATYAALLNLLTSGHKSAMSSVVPDSNGSYDTVITQIQNGIGTSTFTQTWTDSQDSDPNLTHKQVALYTWLYNNYYDENLDYNNLSANTDKTNEADGDMENMESDLEDKAKEQNCEDEVTASTKVDADISKYLDPDLQALPSTRWAGELKEIAAGKISTDPDEMLAEANKSGDNMLDQLLSIASDLGTELRDNLYVTEYIMTMFSYDTIEAETYVKETGSKAGFDTFYEKQGDDYVAKDAYQTYAAKIQTMTNNSINPNMNFLYGDEVEYILYGKNGTTGVYGTIFVIRFALNTVYAFTDAEISNATLAAATALFGTPPLTPLIPFAKAAMTIGLAIAESAYDLVELRHGESVPLMKNSETWVMKPSGIAKEVKNEVKDELIKVTNDVVDQGYKILNDAIAMTTDELQALIDDSEDGLKNLADAALSTVKDKLVNYANEALTKAVELCSFANQRAMLEENYNGLGPTDAKVQAVLDGLDSWLQQQTGYDPAVYEAKQAAVEYLKANSGAVIREIFTTLEAQAQPGALTTVLESKLNEIKDKIEEKVDGLINTAGTALSEQVSALQEKLESAAAEGAETLKKTLSDEISYAFGVVPENGQTASSTSSAVSCLLSWTYSDYLRVFVVVGLFANEEMMLLRMADMIELNMQNKNNAFAVVTTTETQTVTTSRFFGLWKSTSTMEKEVNTVNKDAFSLSKSYTYMTIHATLQVKPLLMTLPFMADTVENQLTGTNWYEIEYTGTLGY